MGFQGKFKDLSLVDILQVVQMTQKTGVLEIFDGPRRASILVREGNIIDARPPGVGRLTDDLEARGLIPKGVKDTVEGDGGAAIGERLVQSGHITAEALQRVLVERVESTVYETLAWVNGQFDFDIMETGAAAAVLQLADVLPGVNFNTQQVLMDALRVFDERRAGRAPELAVAEAAPSPRSSRAQAAVVLAGSNTFRDRVRLVFGGMRIAVFETDTDEEAIAAITEDARRPAVVVLEVGRDATTLRDRIGRLLLAGSYVAVVTAGDDPAAAADAVAGGAWTHIAILPADPGPALAYLQTIVANRLDSLAAGRPAAASAGPLESFSSQISHLRDRLDAIAGEVHTSSVSMKVLEFVAERLERGVLFLVRPTDLQGLGAFGHSADGEPIGPLAAGLRIPLAPDSVFRRVLDGRQSVLSELDPANPEVDALYSRIGRPNPPDALLLPLTSVGSVVALIYADNGFTGRAIAEHAELEVITRQAGLVLENTLLRRMLERERSLTARGKAET